MNGGTLRRTALFDVHLALGARMVPFGGFEMPVQYAGILAEHEAVRSRAGLFDLSHMGQFALRGPRVAEWADALTVNTVAGMKPGQARYNIFTNARGGAHDDVIFYRLDDDRWLLVVNAANAPAMWELITRSPHDGVTLENLHGVRALIAVQGPLAVGLVAPLLDAPIAELRYYGCVETTLTGTATPVLVARTGYTGEDGVELFLDGEAAPGVWDLLMSRGRGIVDPCGLGARDVLRLEAGMPLYGHELTEEIGPIQAGLGWTVKFSKPAFPGREVLAAQRDADDYPRIVGLTMEGRAPARAGYAVYAGDLRVGEVRSGSWAPSVGASVATALVDASAAPEGTRLDVEIRGARHRAVVTPLPFYRRPRER